MSVEVALVEYVSDNIKNEIRSSGLLFSGKFVLITGHVLLPFLKQFDLEGWFNNHDAGVIHYNIFEQNMAPKLNVFTKNQGATCTPAEVIAGFICRNIKESCRKYLKEWTVEFETNTFHTKELVSLFFILELQDNRSNKLKLNDALVQLLHDAGNFMPAVGHEIFIESVPFGNRLFLNSYSQGIVSNVVGENSCMLLTDSPSAPGSEGSPVFIKTQCKKLSAIAIVISCINWWSGEWVGLTLTANLVPMLMQFSELTFNNTGVPKDNLVISSKLMETIRNNLVQVINKSQRGTAILINKQKGIFLTNSHVVASDRVVLNWQRNYIQASVIYKTPNADVYDLAVLRCNPTHIQNLSIQEVTISVTPTQIGEDVFAAGFPLFHCDVVPQPTVTKGSISQSYKGMLNTTCCVLPGTSGGAIFRSNGELLAVVVSNIKIIETGVMHPHNNMAIPILAVHSILQDYLNTGDVEKLHLLHCKDSNIIREWKFLLSKL